MRATDLLTTLSIDFDYLTITGILLEFEGSLYPVAEMTIEEDALVFVPAAEGNKGMTVSQVTTALMLHRSKTLFKRHSEREKVYGYKIRMSDIVI